MNYEQCISFQVDLKIYSACIFIAYDRGMQAPLEGWSDVLTRYKKKKKKMC